MDFQISKTNQLVISTKKGGVNMEKGDQHAPAYVVVHIVIKASVTLYLDYLLNSQTV
jgi:hypothetical protein